MSGATIAKSVKIIVTGQKEIDERLQALEPRVAKKIMRSTMRKALRPMQQLAMQLVPKESGELKKNIRIRAGKRSRQHIQINIFHGGKAVPFKRSFFHGSLQEYGHSRYPKKSQNKNQTGSPRIEGKQYMRKAFEQKAKLAGDEAEYNIVQFLDEAVRGV